MSINWKKSAELNNCSVEWLKARFERFPKSNKRIIAICEGEDCNKEREISFYAYYDLCKTCANKKRWEDPEEHKKQSIAIKKQWSDIEIWNKHSEAAKKRYEDPEERKKTGLKTKNHYAKMDDPGLEMNNHHYIYDHNDLSLNTVQMTRRDHTSLHNVLRGLGYKVPHINEVI